MRMIGCGRGSFSLLIVVRFYRKNRFLGVIDHFSRILLGLGVDLDSHLNHVRKGMPNLVSFIFYSSDFHFDANLYCLN